MTVAGSLRGGDSGGAGRVHVGGRQLGRGSDGYGFAQAGAWGGIQVSGAGSVDLEHACCYAETGLTAFTSGSVQVIDSVFSSMSSGGVQVIWSGQAEVEGNSVIGSGSAPAYSIWENSLDLSQLDGEHATGGIPGLSLRPGPALAASVTLQPEALTWMLQQVTVPQGETLTIAPGRWSGSSERGG